MKIKNIQELGATPLRRHALEIVEKGLQAIDTRREIREQVKIEGERLIIRGEAFSLAGTKHIIVAGAGKCAGAAAAALENVLGDRLEGGVALYVGEEAELKKIKGYRGTHPLPTEKNIEGAKALVAFLGGLTEDDLVIFIVTGGGSTLLCLPEGGGCAEEVRVVRALMDKGATIQEINTVRKHLSYARGGFLAKHAYPARGVSLIFSDVPTDDIGFVASGPTVRDMTTIADAEAVLEKYAVFGASSGEHSRLIETPKEEKYFERVKNILFVSNRTALQAMQSKSEELGYQTAVVTRSLTGDAAGVAGRILHELRLAPPKTALLYGGETTTVVRHPEGRGGRNLAFALAGLSKVGDGELLLSVASDGHDNTEFAGAICDTITAGSARELSIDAVEYLERDNSYEFFKKTGSYLVTGDTGSNVSDLVVALKI